MQHAPDAAQACRTCAGMCFEKDLCANMCIKFFLAALAWTELVAILAEGAIALSVTHSGGVLFAS